MMSFGGERVDSCPNLLLGCIETVVMSWGCDNNCKIDLASFHSRNLIPMLTVLLYSNYVMLNTSFVGVLLG